MSALIRPLPETPVFRAPPHNVEAEQALLGAILVNNEAIDRVSSFLKPTHFYDALHGRIYEAASKLILGGKRATPITLKTFFQADEPVGELSVPQYLGRLAANATTIINAEDYGRTVYDLAIRRELIGIGEQMVNTAFDSPIDAPPAVQIEEAEQALFEIAETGKYGSGFEPFSAALTDAIDMAANAYRRDGGLSGLATGFTDLDHRMGGLQPSDLIIVAGRPSMGKTALATNIAYHVAKSYKPGEEFGECARRRRGRLLLARNVGRAARHPHHLRAGLYPVRAHPPRAHRLRTSSTASSKSPRSCRPCRSISTRPAASAWLSLPPARAG